MSSESLAMDPWLDRLREAVRNDAGYMLEDFFQQSPEAEDDPELAVALIYEEHCLLRELGIEQSVNEVLQRFPKWASKVRVVFECDALLENHDEHVNFPEAGEAFGDFQLLRELGRGARGRVYLARQPSLSDRPVVLKLAATSGDEHLSLARLQHSAIVPLLFALEDDSEGVRTLCMPYLGACTLARAMESMAAQDVAQRKGVDFAAAINEHRIDFENQTEDPATAPAIRFLQSADYERAVCWIVSCLAEGVDCAHRRGLLHLDIKPSNILLADDGQPMLLDFHLAREIKELATGVSSIGGTPGYMAPEHLHAIDAISSGQTAGQAVDQRTDVYSLGLVMRDLLSGAIPPPVHSQHESPRRAPHSRHVIAKQISPAVRQVMQRVLANDPDQRYQTAGELAQDLRKVVNPEAKRQSNPTVVGFSAGVLIGAAIVASFWWSDSGANQQAAPAKTIAPTPRLFDELHRFIAQARDGGILQNASDAELSDAQQTCSRLWAQRQRIVASIDPHRDDQTIVSRLKNDLQDLATLYCELILRTENESIDRDSRVNQIRREAESLDRSSDGTETNNKDNAGYGGDKHGR